MERFVKPYKIKKIMSLNAVKLELLSTVKIHLVVNISRICKYIAGRRTEKGATGSSDNQRRGRMGSKKDPEQVTSKREG